MTLFCSIRLKEGKNILCHILDHTGREITVAQGRDIISLNQFISLQQLLKIAVYAILEWFQLH